MASQDFVEGYRDGSTSDALTPGANRSDAYRHGFMNAQDDRCQTPRASAQLLREQANQFSNDNTDITGDD